MSILNLPIEVLTQIMEDTIHNMPESFENLLMTCKSIYASTPDLRLKHNHLKKRYRHFSYDLYKDDSDGDEDKDDAEEAAEIANHLEKCYSSLQLLLRIADEPLIRTYMITADFKNDLVPEDERITEIVAEQARTSTNLLSLLASSVYFIDAGINPQTVLDHLVDRYEPEPRESGLAATFLLSLLPNITELSIPEVWETYAWDQTNTFWKMDSALQDIVARANDPDDPTAGLSKLTTILPSAAWGYDCRWALSTFNHFLSIKSVTKFIAGSCRAIDDGYTGARFRDPEDGNYGLNIQEVVLAGSVVDGKELATFLLRLPRIKDLKISYEPKWHGCGHDMDSAAIMSSIESSIGDRLESLSFSMLEFYGEIQHTIHSMKGFTMLKELEVDIMLLAQKGQGGIMTAAKLGDILPKSLVKFVLIVDDIETCQNGLHCLFDDAAVEMEEKLPNLRELVIRYRVQEDLDLRAQDETDGSKNGRTVQLLMKCLKPLGELLTVTTVRLPSKTLAVASFMEDFCEKYRVRPE